MATTAARPKPKQNYHRREEESDVIWLVKYVQSEYPDAIVECDYAAGLNLTDSQRVKLMQMRSEKGMPDIRIYYPSRGYHGLVIEMKKDGTVIYKKDGSLRKAPYVRRFKKYGKLFITRGDHNQEQHDTLMKFERLGYCGRYAIGRNHGQELVDRYMNRKQQFEF